MAFVEAQGEQLADLASPFVTSQNFNIPVNGLNLGAIMQPYTDNSSNGGYGVEGVSRLFGSTGGNNGPGFVPPSTGPNTAYSAVNTPARLTNADNKKALLIGGGIIGGIGVLVFAITKVKRK